MSTFISIMLTGIISVLGFMAMLFVFGIMDIKILKEYLLKNIKIKSQKDKLKA